LPATVATRMAAHAASGVLFPVVGGAVLALAWWYGGWLRRLRRQDVETSGEVAGKG
jgi:hypothetical protein